jgi:hypothetical protein
MRWLPVFFTVTGIERVSPGETVSVCRGDVICWLKTVKASLVPPGSAGACGLELGCSVCDDLHPEETAQESITREMQSAGATQPTLSAEVRCRCSGALDPFVFCITVNQSPFLVLFGSNSHAVKPIRQNSLVYQRWPDWKGRIPGSQDLCHATRAKLCARSRRSPAR